jgi:hypothetical protein
MDIEKSEMSKNKIPISKFARQQLITLGIKPRLAFLSFNPCQHVG